MKVKENKLNWNGLKQNQQELIDRIIDREVLTLANQLIEDVFKKQEDEFIEIENLIDEETEDYKEIFQYFIVSKYLYDKLNSVNASIFKYKGLFFWGRTDFGQCLSMNHELKQITKNITTD